MPQKLLKLDGEKRWSPRCADRHIYGFCTRRPSNEEQEGCRWESVVPWFILQVAHIFRDGLRLLAREVVPSRRWLKRSRRFATRGTPLLAARRVRRGFGPTSRSRHLAVLGGAEARGLAVLWHSSDAVTQLCLVHKERGLYATAR